MAHSSSHTRTRCALFLAALLLLPARTSCGLSYPLPPATNPAPTIGVLSVPITDAGSPCDTAAPGSTNTSSCFTSFYFRWLQAAGARAVVLPVDADASTLDALLDSVNGVLFSGGSLENLSFSSAYMTAAAHIYSRVLQKNDNGTFFPLHGTCQGFQVLALLTSQDQGVMQYGAFDAEGLVIPLDISVRGRGGGLACPSALCCLPYHSLSHTRLACSLAQWDGHHSSRLFSAVTAPDSVVDTLGSENSTINLHHDGVPVAAFEASHALSSFYILASTNFDRAGKAFVSTMEAWGYPVTATQWHPERNALEWRDDIALSAHSPSAVAAAQYLAAFFVGDARRNTQAFSNTTLLSKYSVYSYPLVGAADAALSGYQWLVYTD